MRLVYKSSALKGRLNDGIWEVERSDWYHHSVFELGSLFVVVHAGGWIHIQTHIYNEESPSFTYNWELKFYRSDPNGSSFDEHFVNHQKQPEQLGGHKRHEYFIDDFNRDADAGLGQRWAQGWFGQRVWVREFLYI